MDHGFSSADNGSVTVGSSSTLVLNNKTGRLYALLVNDSDETIYIALGEDAVLNSGIPLFPYGGSLELDGEEPFKGVIRAICASGGKNLTYIDA